MGGGRDDCSHLRADGQPRAHPIDQIHEAAAPAPRAGGGVLRGGGGMPDRLALGNTDRRPGDLCGVDSVCDFRPSPTVRGQDVLTTLLFWYPLRTCTPRG